VHAVAARTNAYAVWPPAWSSLDRILVGLATWAVHAARAIGHGHERLAESVEDLADRRIAALASRSEAADDGATVGPWLERLQDRLVAWLRRPTDAWRDLVAAGRALARRLDRTHLLQGATRTERQRRAREAARAAAGELREAQRDRFVHGARREVRRISRDVGVAIAVVFVVWLSLLASLTL